MNREEWCDAAYWGMFQHALRLARDREVAEDMTQEVFLRFVRTWKPAMETWAEEQIWKWLLVILNNYSRDLWRRNALRPHVSLDEALPLSYPQETERVALLNVAFREAMRRIGPTKTHLLLDYYLRGVTPEEFMQEMSISYHGAMCCIYRARNEFRAAYRRTQS